VNYTPNDIVLLPSVPTPPAAMISSEADTYLGLLIMAAFWAFFRVYPRTTSWPLNKDASLREWIR
jgi:hypothetical protein